MIYVFSRPQTPIDPARFKRRNHISQKEDQEKFISEYNADILFVGTGQRASSILISGQRVKFLFVKITVW